MINLGLLAIAAGLVVGTPLMTADTENPVTETTDTDTDIADTENTEGTEGTEGTDTDTADTDTDVPEAPEVFECTTTSSVYWIKDGETIQDGAKKYGDVYISVEKGHVGDEVTAIIAGNPTMDLSTKVVTLYRYNLSYVTVNGVKVEASDSEKGEYKFTLVEGVNDVKAYFSGRTEISVMDLSTINWKSLLTVDNLMKLIYFAITLFLSSGFFITLIKSKKYEQKTQKEITNTVQASADEVIENFMSNTVKPLLEKQSEQTASSNETAKTLMRVVTYALNGSSEDKLAALKEMQSLGTNDEALNKQIQEIVKQSMADSEKKKEEKAKAIEEAKKSVENLSVDADTGLDTEEDTGNYGKL